MSIYVIPFVKMYLIQFYTLKTSWTELGLRLMWFSFTFIHSFYLFIRLCLNYDNMVTTEQNLKEHIIIIIIVTC